MASGIETESLDEEIKELLRNFKFKKATVYEPCTHENIKECLIGLHEELELLNVSYVFNPYCDLLGQTLHPEALVKLINSIWTLLHYHKSSAQKAKDLEEVNHVLEHINKQLNGVVDRLKSKINSEKNEVKACKASAQRISENSDEIVQSLSESRARLMQLSKQKETKEKSLHNEITRLKLENEQLRDRLRNKTGGFTPCAQVCDSTILQLKERERKQQAVIATLQRNTQDLLKEVLVMKEKLILNGIN